MPVRETQPFRSRKAMIDYIKSYSGQCKRLGRVLKQAARKG